MTTPLPPVDVRRRLREDAAYLRGCSQGIQHTAWALQRRAQFLRAAAIVQHSAEQIRHLAAVWNRAGWLVDVELPNEIAAAEPQILSPCGRGVVCVWKGVV